MPGSKGNNVDFRLRQSQLMLAHKSKLKQFDKYIMLDLTFSNIVILQRDKDIHNEKNDKKILAVNLHEYKRIDNRASSD